MRRACKKIWIFLCIFSFVGVPGVARADDYKERTLQELARLLKNLLEETEKKGPSKKNPSPSDHKLAVESATPAAEQVKYEAAIEKHASNAHLDSKNPNFKKSALALLEAAEERLNARGYRLGPIQVDPEGRAGLGFEILTTGKDPLGKVLEKSQKRFGHRLFIGIFGQILGTYEVKKKVMTLHPIAFSHPSGATSMIALHEIRHAYLASKAEAGKPTPLSTFAYAMGDMPVSNLPGYEKFLSFEEISTNFRTLKQLSETPVSKAELLGLTQLEKIYQTGKDIYTIADDIKKLNELGLQVLADSESKLTFLPRNFNSPYLAIQLPAAQGKTSPGILVLSLDRKFADATLSSVRAAAMDSLRASLAEAENLRRLTTEHLDKIVARVEASSEGSFSRPRSSEKSSTLEGKSEVEISNLRASEKKNAVALQRQVDFELNHNQAAPGRSDKPIRLRHLEIPLEQLNFDATELSDALKATLIFTRENKQYFRWILNPEDTAYGEMLKTSLKEKGVSYRELEYFNGYLSASRSVFVTDPTTGTVISIKASTNKTGGRWKDKKETERAAKAGRLISDHIRERSKVTENRHFRYLEEPVAASFSPADQAVIVREYPHLNSPTSSKRLIPFFSIIQSELGEKIAKENGANTPEKIFSYWKRHLFEPWGKSAAEAALNFGIFSNSAHSQNYLLEVEEKNGRFLPTGKIYARDLSDGGLIEPIVRGGSNGQKLISLYETFDSKQNPILSDNAEINYSPFIGDNGRSQSWISAEMIEKWRDGFMAGFESRFRELAGFEIELVPQRKFFHELRGHTKMVIGNGITDSEFKELKKRIPISTPAIRSPCAENFGKLEPASKRTNETQKRPAQVDDIENFDKINRRRRWIPRRPGQF